MKGILRLTDVTAPPPPRNCHSYLLKVSCGGHFTVYLCPSVHGFARLVWVDTVPLSLSVFPQTGPTVATSITAATSAVAATGRVHLLSSVHLSCPPLLSPLLV